MTLVHGHDGSRLCGGPGVCTICTLAAEGYVKELQARIAALEAREKELEGALRDIVNQRPHASSCGDTNNPFNKEMLGTCNCGAFLGREIKIARAALAGKGGGE